MSSGDFGFRILDLGFLIRISKDGSTMSPKSEIQNPKSKILSPLPIRLLALAALIAVALASINLIDRRAMIRMNDFEQQRSPRAQASQPQTQRPEAPTSAAGEAP
jgi:hypothetical protein